MEVHDVQTGQDGFAKTKDFVVNDLKTDLQKRFKCFSEDPILVAAKVFDHRHWPRNPESPDFVEYGNKSVGLLVSHFGELFALLGGDPEVVDRQWLRLKRLVTRSEALQPLNYRDLYHALYDGFSEPSNPGHCHSILILAAIVHCFAVDTSVCERGFSLMNALKSAARSVLGLELLRDLMTIGTLGQEWSTEPASIPVDKVIQQWRENSQKGRYENTLLWGTQALQELLY